MPTINQLVRKPRVAENQEQGSCSGKVPAKAWSLHSRLYHHPEKAELGAA
jgi:hypothetical protein